MSVRGCFQGVIGAKATEVRLREINKEFTYLTRESDIKKGKFILSWLSKDGLVKHTTTPNPSARNNFKKLEDALPILENMILSNDDDVEEGQEAEVTAEHGDGERQSDKQVHSEYALTYF